MLSDIIKSTILKQWWIERALIHFLNFQENKIYVELVI